MKHIMYALIAGSILIGMVIEMNECPDCGSKLIYCEEIGDDDYYHCDWMYTKDAQELLNFQHYTFDDFLKVFRKKIRFRRFLISLVKPIARKFLLNKSPYYTKPKRTKRKGRTQRKPIKTQN